MCIPSHTCPACGKRLTDAGPDTLELRTSVPIRGWCMKSLAASEVAEGDRITFALNHHLSYKAAPGLADRYLGAIAGAGALLWATRRKSAE